MRAAAFGCSRALLVVAALATMRITDSEPVGVGSFSELSLAVASGARAIEIAPPEIVFDHSLEVRTALLIKSAAIGATLSGGDRTRLFFLQNGSKLSLHGVNLVAGSVLGSCDWSVCLHQGGAIFMNPGSELRLHSAHVFGNRADYGGAIYAISSEITATDC